jgi:hypothetical protein
MDFRTYDEDILVGPFIGFIVGTMYERFERDEISSLMTLRLFGLTILQASHYYYRFTNDSVFCKLKVCIRINYCQTPKD